MKFLNPQSFSEAVVTVMGLGRYLQGSGLGATKWLMRHGAQTVITDLKSEEDLKDSVAVVMESYRAYREKYPDRTIFQPLFVLGQHREEDFVNADCVVQNPGVPSESAYVKMAREKGVAIESDVSLFFRFFHHPIFAVTGTKGKTTTTTIFGEMMKKKNAQAIVAGNIKISPLEFLDELEGQEAPPPVVLELSSWLLDSLPQALQDIGHGPDIAVLTNVYPDHLDRYPSFAAYQQSKEIIFAYQRPDQYTVLNRDHDLVREMSSRVKAQLFWYSLQPAEAGEQGCFVQNGEVVFVRNGQTTPILPVAEVKIQGTHNLSNALAGACAAILGGAALADVADVLRVFEGVADRQEIIREIDEVTYVNDTTATAPDAVVPALERFGKEKKVILIAGGVDKKLSYTRMCEGIVTYAKHLILFPGTASDIIEPAVLGKVKIEHAHSMAEAVKKAAALAERGDTVLLSPGGSSFNMFKNEFDRGDQFREEVRNL